MLPFFVRVILIDPPDVALDEDAEQVDEPYKGGTEEKDDGDDDAYGVVGNKALAKTDDVPYDVKGGEAKNNFDNKGQIFYGFDEIFHSKFSKFCICGYPLVGVLYHEKRKVSISFVKIGG